MAVRFIIGASGTGKTRFIYDEMIRKSMDQDHAPIIFMLPEQSNMIAEQDMVELHPQGGTMDISILSFTRLAFMVFDKESIYTGDVLDDYGKSMLVRKVLSEHTEELAYYGNMTEKEGFVSEIKSVISELYQYGITVDKLAKILENISPDISLYHKLSDIRIILQAFEEEMGSTFMVAEQVLSLLAEHVEESGMLRGAEVYFDGFTGFTPVQYEVIKHMMGWCGNLYFSITIDEKSFLDNSYSRFGLFGIGKETIEYLSRLASDNNVMVLPHITLSDNRRINGDDELKHFGNNIFRFPVHEMPTVNNDVVNNLTGVNIIEADDTLNEILTIGRLVQYYVRELGFRYRDIAILTGDLDDNIEAWNQIMRQLEIPFFADCNEKLMNNRIALIVSAVIELFENDFSFDSVFAYLKTELTGIDIEDIYLLENYALSHGIRGYSRWSKPFKGNTKNLSKINEIRKNFIDSIAEFYPVLSKKEGTAEEYIVCLYSFLSRYQLGESLWKQADELEEEGDLRQSMAYRKAYEKLLAVMDKTVDVLGKQVVSRNTLAEIIYTGLSDMRLGVIPSTLDEVVIGDMERTRFHNVKVLFVAGANEGLLPKPVGSGGIISDTDRKKLMDMDVILSPDSARAYYIQQFYLYMQMTQASDKLIISYRKSDRRGNALNASFFVKYVIQMFPNKEVISSDHVVSLLFPVTVKDMDYELAKTFSKEEFVDASILKLLLEKDPDNTKIILDGYLYMNRPGALNEAVAKRIYGRRMLHSVSRLESFAACQYQFFLQYGLHLSKPEEYKVENNHIGTILHAVMERFFTEVNEGKIVLPAAKEVIDIKVKELAIDAAKEINDTIFESSFRMEHSMNVIIRIAQRSIDNLLRHLEQGEMKPEYFEKEFSYKDDISYIHMDIDDETQMYINGVIDRVDIKETDDAVYVKVIDYKSGYKDIDFVKVSEGKQLQLAVYLSVMLEYLKKQYPDKKIIPVGMCYFQLADKVVEGYLEDEVEKDRVKSSRMSGLVNSDDNCLEMLDHKTGSTVPVSYKNNKELSANNSHVVTGDEMLAISEFTRNKMIEFGKEIIRGQIDMKPQKGEISSPCNYCDFKSVCRFEAGLGGNAYGIGSQLGKAEAKALVIGKLSSDDKADEEGNNELD